MTNICLLIDSSLTAVLLIAPHKFLIVALPVVLTAVPFVKSILRNARKLSQAELAEKLEISIPFLSDVENSRKWVSPATLVKFADSLGVEPYELLKPQESLSPNMSLTIEKWSGEVIQAVTQTVKNIQEYYTLSRNTRKK